MAKIINNIIEHDGKKISISGYETDHVYRSIIRHDDFYEKGLLWAISRHLNGRPTGTIIDGGANLGNHTLYFAMFCPCTKVIAYEPYEPTLKILEKNIADNKLQSKVDIRPVGLYSKEAKLEVSFFSEGNYGATEFVESNNPDATKAVSLDLDCKDEVVSCIKLDIQGLEQHVLRGAKNILRTQEPLLVIEAMTKPEYNAIKKYLAKFGYRIYPASRYREHYNSSPTYIFGK